MTPTPPSTWPNAWPNNTSSTVQAINIPTGAKFGRLTVIRQSERIGKNRAFLCECDCGSLKVIQGRYLRIGVIQSCGCLRTAKGKEKSDHPLYQTWKRMHAVSTNRRHAGYPAAGALGVRVCEQWESFDKFLEDMGPKPKRTLLVRLDKMKDFTPDNCRWLTAMQLRAINYPKTIHDDTTARLQVQDRAARQAA